MPDLGNACAMVVHEWVHRHCEITPVAPFVSHFTLSHSVGLGQLNKTSSDDEALVALPSRDWLFFEVEEVEKELILL